MIKVTFDELKNNLDEYVTKSLDGEKIVIVEGDKKLGTFEPSMHVVKNNFIKNLTKNFDRPKKNFIDTE